MLPLDVIKKFYPYASEDELKDIQEVVYLLACAIMQHFYGSRWREVLKSMNRMRNNELKASSSPVRVLGYRIIILQFLAIS